LDPEPYLELYSELMPTPKTKNGFEPRTCEKCGLKFEWRKKWAKDWESVKYCSKKCKG
jgi:hypothetical protein